MMVMETPFQEKAHQVVTVYSIGHSNQSVKAFLELLRTHGIQMLIDVRSSPYSKYVPHFNSSALAATVPQDNIKYLFMGDELGGRPNGDEFYDAQHHVLYSHVAASAVFLNGISRLKELARASRVAIMCSEEDPAICHRHLLVSRVLAEQGITVLHIRGDGHLQTEEELTQPEEKPAYEQSLWGEQLPERKEQAGQAWRSIRPVSRRKQQQSSLEL
jgi:uncharacterized protein (DUF488 family)